MSKTPSFEEAYTKLEEILEKMTKSEVSLDEALNYYDEADKLLEFCSKKLNEAEQKIQILTKNKEGKSELQNFESNTTCAIRSDENLN